MEKFTTGNTDADWQIFKLLPDQDIISLCRVNKEMAKLGEDEKFWEFLCKERKYLKQLVKPKFLGWKAFYVKATQLPHYTLPLSSVEPIKEKIEVLRSLIEKPHRKIYIGDLTKALFGKDKYILFMVTQVTNDKVTMECLKFDANKKLHIPFGAQKIFLKVGMNAYKILFDTLLQEFKIPSLHIEIDTQGYTHEFIYGLPF